MMNARLFALVLAVASLAATCAPPPPPGPCNSGCGLTSIARDKTYAGQLTAPDGATVDVKVNVAANARTTLTFTQGEHTIVEVFDGTAGTAP